MGKEFRGKDRESPDCVFGSVHSGEAPAVTRAVPPGREQVQVRGAGPSATGKGAPEQTGAGGFDGVPRAGAGTAGGPDTVEQNRGVSRKWPSSRGLAVSGLAAGTQAQIGRKSAKNPKYLRKSRTRTARTPGFARSGKCCGFQKLGSGQGVAKPQRLTLLRGKCRAQGMGKRRPT